MKQLHGKTETCRASEWQSHRSDPDGSLKSVYISPRNDSTPEISSRGFCRGGTLQYRLGTLLSLRSAMAVSILRLAATKSSGHLRVPRDGRWSLWNYLLRGCPRSRARVVARTCGIDRKDPWPRRPGEVDLEWCLANVNNCPLSPERSDLVDSVRAISLRCVAVSGQRVRSPTVREGNATTQLL